MPIDWLLSPAALGVLGLAIGSFLNVVIHRLPQMLERGWLADAGQFLQDETAMRRTFGERNGALAQFAKAGSALAAELEKLPALGIARPRSRCPSCGHVIAWYENIPLVSWALLRGRCSACKVRISARYPLVEALTGVLFAAIAWHFGPVPASAVYCVAAAFLVAAAFIDLDTTLLPDTLTLPLIGLGIVAAWLHWIPVALADATLGAFFGYFSLWAMTRLYKLLRGVEGMAEGDFKLLAGLGALLGWTSLLSVVLLASAVGAATGLYLIAARGHRRETPIPFGPYLAGGGVAALFFGPQLAAFWLPA